MKKLQLFAILCSTAVLLSCSKNPTNDPSLPGDPAIIKVQVAGNGSLKSSGAPTAANESKIGKGIIFVFRGTGSNPALDGKATFDFSSQAPTPVEVSITAGAVRHIYVIANIANESDFANVNKVSDLYNLTNKYQLSAMRTGTNLGMSGFVQNVDASTASLSSPLAVTVPLNFIGSRVHLDWETDLPSNLTGLTVTGAYLLNVKSKTDYFSAPSTYLTLNVMDYLRGKSNITGFSGSYLPGNGTTNVYDSELVVANLNADKGFANNYFYITENNSPAPTIVVLEGTLSGTVYYYPIVINGDQNGSGTGGTTNNGDKSSVVSRGNIYYVKAIIKGLGNSDPYEPLKKAAINVTITPATWNTVINIDQEFN